MTVVIGGFFFFLGAIIASFIGVIVARLNTGQGFLVGRSRCDACNVELAAPSLLPIISFILSRGRSRCCAAKISFASPLSETLLGGLFVLAYLKLGFGIPLCLMLISLSVLLALVSYDLKHQILPPPLLRLFIVTSFLFAFSTSPSTAILLSTFIAASLMALFFASLHVLSRGRAMGFADAPLVFGLALLSGSQSFPGFMFSFWIGAVIGVALLYRRPAGSRMGVEVPFAPFLAAGFLLAYFTQWNPFIFIANLSLR